MKEINVNDLVDLVAAECIKMSYHLSEDVAAKLEEMEQIEDGVLAKTTLQKIIENAKVAQNEQRPLCQDTGMVVCFVKLGQDVHLVGGSLQAAINKGVAKGYESGYLRKSVVNNVYERINTKDNTPAVIHIELVEGDCFEIEVAAKGFGSENMSQLKMLPPSAGIQGIKDFVLKVVKEAGPNPCPPIIVGIGIGGNFELSAMNAKKAVLKDLDSKNEDPFLANLEQEIFAMLNASGIGPQGFGGYTTSLGVNIISAPTHIAGLPVAVNIQCHAQRHGKVVL